MLKISTCRTFKHLTCIVGNIDVRPDFQHIPDHPSLSLLCGCMEQSLPKAVPLVKALQSDHGVFVDHPTATGFLGCPCLFLTSVSEGHVRVSWGAWLSIAGPISPCYPPELPGRATQALGQTHLLWSTTGGLWSSLSYKRSNTGIMSSTHFLYIYFASINYKEGNVIQ